MMVPHKITGSCHLNLMTIASQLHCRFDLDDAASLISDCIGQR